MPPLGRFEEEDPVDDPATPLPSIREERDLRLTDDEVDEMSAGTGELCRVLGAEPLATGEAAAVSTPWSCAADDETWPFGCDCACCCLARAAAAADPGGGGTGIADAAEEGDGDEGGRGLLRDILLR